VRIPFATIALFIVPVATAVVLGGGCCTHREAKSNALGSGGVFEASPDTRAKTGITRYVLDSEGNGAALAEDGTVIVSFAETREKTHVILIHALGRQVEMIFTVQKTTSGLGLEGTVDGTPFGLSVAKDGSRTGVAPKLDPAFEPICRAITADFGESNAASGIPRSAPPTKTDRAPKLDFTFEPNCSTKTNDWEMGEPLAGIPPSDPPIIFDPVCTDITDAQNGAGIIEGIFWLKLHWKYC